MRTKSRLPISESVNKTLKEIARKMGGQQLRVGFLEGATYPDGTPVAAVAFWDEFGHGGRFPSPPRPYFRGMIAKEQGGWGAKTAKLAKATNYDGMTVLKLMGEDIAGALKQSIADFDTPGLSPTTLILRKRFWGNPEAISFSDVVSAARAAAQGQEGASGTQAKPLIWTGHLINSVGYEVTK